MSNETQRHPLTNWPGQTDSGINPITGLPAEWLPNENFRSVVDYEDREGHPDPMSYLILANDLLTIRDATYTIQESLGMDPRQSSLPGSVTLTVEDRFLRIEGGTALAEAHFDSRYGGLPQTLLQGTNWTEIYNNNAGLRQKLTILGHAHDGQFNSKVNLVNHVTSKLLPANINLDQLTGSNIYTNSSKTEFISGALQNVLRLDNSSNQVAQGPVTFQGNQETKLIKEADIRDNISSGYSVVADNEAWSGFAFRGTTSIDDGIFYNRLFNKTRYGRYSIGIRSKSSNVSSSTSIARIIVRNATTNATIKSFYIRPNMYNVANVYQTVYTDFTFNGVRPQENIRVTVTWHGNGKGINWSAESLIIAPLHLSIYDI